MKSSSITLRSALSLLAALVVLHGCAAPDEADLDETRADPNPPRSIELPAAAGAFAPHLAADGDGLLLSWLERVELEGDGGETVAHRLRYARFADDGWSAVSTIAEGDDLFANWADVPSVARSGDGSLVAHWLAKSGEETYAYGIQVARSTDEGGTWQRLGRLNDDEVSDQEHGFVTFVPEDRGADGEVERGVRAFWLDGRKMADEGPMTVRTAFIGESIEPSDEVAGRVCECCPTGAAATAEGAVVVYRGRSEAEVRDLFAVRRESEGWGEPVSVAEDGWMIPGCPVNGPGVEASGEALGVSWFTASNETPRVQAAFSTDSGRSFGEPIVVDDGRPLGRVDLVLLEAAEAIVSWLAVPGDSAEVNLRRVRSDGTAGEPIVVAETGAGRSSGYPELERLGDTLYLAWVETVEDSPSRVRLAEIPLDSVPGPGP